MLASGVCSVQQVTEGEDKACPRLSPSLLYELRWAEVQATWKDEEEVGIVLHRIVVDDMGLHKEGILRVAGARPGYVLRRRMALQWGCNMDQLEQEK
jgi:hypothetical protein